MRDAAGALSRGRNRRSRFTTLAETRSHAAAELSEGEKESERRRNLPATDARFERGKSAAFLCWCCPLRLAWFKRHKWRHKA